MKVRIIKKGKETYWYEVGKVYEVESFDSFDYVLKIDRCYVIDKKDCEIVEENDDTIDVLLSAVKMVREELDKVIVEDFDINCFKENNTEGISDTSIYFDPCKKEEMKEDEIKVGDVFECVNNGFESFSKGNEYELIKIGNNIYCLLDDDNNLNHLSMFLFNDLKKHFKKVNKKDMKSIKIGSPHGFDVRIPEGYEIDKEKSTFENIVFKEIDNFPMSWEDLKTVEGYYINTASNICSANTFTESTNRNTIPSKAEAEGILALIQLLQLRDRVNGDWKPDWTDGIIKYNIVYCSDSVYTINTIGNSHAMHFKTEELRDRFLEVHRELLEKAKMFL